MTPSTQSPCSQFIFATGIECSYPRITTPHGKKVRIDELESTFHYRHWRRDLELVKDLGIRYLRYGPPYYKLHLSYDLYDWEFTDQVFAYMRTLQIEPIVDLCHFGVPDWIGDFQNPDWPLLFAAYARDFANRYPWIRFYTPVNEIYVCAKLSALAGFWNEQLHDERSFVTALKHLCMANLLAVSEILNVQPDAVFIQSESAEHFHIGSHDQTCIDRASFENRRRFLSFDLLYSHPPAGDMVSYLFDNGMTRAEYNYFMTHGLGDVMVMGNDFYERNEQIVMQDGGLKPAGEVLGWSAITRQYYERFRRPTMHTETNYNDAERAPRWLWKEFFNVLHLREQGIPVLGFTWYSLLDRVDWDNALRIQRGVVNPVGLYDLQRKLNPVGAAYRELIQHFKGEPLFPHSTAVHI